MDNKQKNPQKSQFQVIEGSKNIIKTTEDAEIKLDVAIEILKEALESESISTKDLYIDSVRENLIKVQDFLGYRSYYRR